MLLLCVLWQQTSRNLNLPGNTMFLSHVMSMMFISMFVATRGCLARALRCGDLEAWVPHHLPTLITGTYVVWGKVILSLVCVILFSRSGGGSVPLPPDRVTLFPLSLRGHCNPTLLEKDLGRRTNWRTS